MPSKKKALPAKKGTVSYRTRSGKVEAATDMSAAEESDALISVPPPPDLDARQAEMGIKRKTGGPDLSAFPKPKVKPSKVPPTTADKPVD